MRKAERGAFASCLLLSVAQVGFAQKTNSSEVRGTGTDSSGAVLPGGALSKRFCGSAYRKERRRDTKPLTIINYGCQNPGTKVQT